MSWSEVKAKQSENITKLYEKNPDNWFLLWQMSRPEEERTGFAPYDGICWNCHKDITDGDNGITIDKLGSNIITGCPHCHKSFCN